LSYLSVDVGNHNFDLKISQRQFQIIKQVVLKSGELSGATRITLLSLSEQGCKVTTTHLSDLIKGIKTDCKQLTLASLDYNELEEYLIQLKQLHELKIQKLTWSSPGKLLKPVTIVSDRLTSIEINGFQSGLALVFRCQNLKNLTIKARSPQT
jgi:hypothetical protein